jgi:hypothetical protein
VADSHFLIVVRAVGLSANDTGECPEKWFPHCENPHHLRSFSRLFLLFFTILPYPGVTKIIGIGTVML